MLAADLGRSFGSASQAKRMEVRGGAISHATTRFLPEAGHLMFVSHAGDIFRSVR